MLFSILYESIYDVTGSL